MPGSTAAPCSQSAASPAAAFRVFFTALFTDTSDEDLKQVCLRLAGTTDGALVRDGAETFYRGALAARARAEQRRAAGVEEATGARIQYPAL